MQKPFLEFKFKKALGQNFIFDTNFLKSIVSDAGVDSSTSVLEIGTGAATLTKMLGESAKHVVSYEIDENLRSTIENNLSGLNNVEVCFKDVMKADIKEIESKFDGNYIMVANLPYYITTPILFKFLEEATRLERLVIMVQLEVANRICAKPGTEDYGTITPSIDYRGDAKIIRRVSRKMFTPVPNVDSAIVRIDLKENKYKIEDEKLLNQVIRAAFSMRRKTLVNNLKAIGFNQEKIEFAFKQIGLDLRVRGESLSTAQFVELSNWLGK